MPEGSIKFVVNAPREKVWAFLSDLEKVGSCIPGVRSVHVLDDRRADWDLAVKVGPLSQDVRVTTETLESLGPSRARFRGVSDEIEMMGTIQLEAKGKRTGVTYTMDVRAKGPLALVVDTFIQSKLNGQTAEFAANVKRALEG